jgi:hypothetical protein
MKPSSNRTDSTCVESGLRQTGLQADLLIVQTGADSPDNRTEPTVNGTELNYLQLEPVYLNGTN